MKLDASDHTGHFQHHPMASPAGRDGNVGVIGRPRLLEYRIEVDNLM